MLSAETHIHRKPAAFAAGFCSVPIELETQHLVLLEKSNKNPPRGVEKKRGKVGISTVDIPCMNWYNIIDTL